jgi:hypothetical protein
LTGINADRLRRGTVRAEVLLKDISNRVDFDRVRLPDRQATAGGGS